MNKYKQRIIDIWNVLHKIFPEIVVHIIFYMLNGGVTITNISQIDNYVIYLNKYRFYLRKDLIIHGPHDYMKPIEYVWIPAGFDVIPFAAFYKCDRLIRVDIPDSISHIYSDAFCGCKNLTEIVLSKNITKIWGYIDQHIHVRFRSTKRKLNEIEN